MSDIVERLGQKARGERNLAGDLWGDWLCDDAASEIRRLRRIVDGTREWAAVTDARLAEAVKLLIAWDNDYPHGINDALDDCAEKTSAFFDKHYKLATSGELVLCNPDGRESERLAGKYAAESAILEGRS